jgi:glutathione-regulated potassium-efflux system ancillary protein KefC
MDVLWIALAYGLGLMLTKLGLPPLVGYLLAGLALHLLGAKSTPTLEQLSNIGILLMLFSVGLKLRVASLLRLEVIGVGGLHLIVVTLIFLVGLIVLLPGLSGLFVAIALGFSSTVLALKLLEDKSELNSYHGRIAVGILILQDIVAVVLLAFVGAKTPNLAVLGVLALPLLRPVVQWLLDKSGHSELMLLFGIVLALLGGEAARAAGVSPELGALLFGALLAGHGQTTELSKMLWGLKEAFLVAFFLGIGMAGLPSIDILPLGAILLLLLPLKAVLFFYLFTRFGLRARTAFITALSLSTYGEFALIVVVPLVKSGAVSSEWAALISIVVSVSLMIAAPLNRSSHVLYERWEQFLLRFEQNQRHPDAEPTSLGQAHWLVIGMGRTGGAVYRMLHDAGEAVVGLDSDPAKLEHHRNKGRRVLYGDAEDSELWERLNLERLDGVVLTMPDFEAKHRALLGLQSRKFSGIVAVTSYHHEEDDQYNRAGANLVFRPFAEAGERLAERVLEAKTKLVLPNFQSPG